VKRLFAVVLGALGISAWLRRRRRAEPEPTPADDLRAKLAETRPEPDPAPEPEPEPEPEPSVEPAAEDVASRRTDVHDRARQAIAELRDESE
jgi:hypothetical protein